MGIELTSRPHEGPEECLKGGNQDSENMLAGQGAQDGSEGSQSRMTIHCTCQEDLKETSSMSWIKTAHFARNSSRPPPTPRMRPAPDPVWLSTVEDFPELELPEASNIVPAMPPPTPLLGPVAPPFFEDFSEVALPDSPDPAVCEFLPEHKRPERELPETMEPYPSVQMFTLDGFSDCSSDAGSNDLSLRELCNCDADDAPDALSRTEFSFASVTISNSASKLEDPVELQAPAPVKVLHDALESLCGSPILTAIWRAPSSCSTRECTPSPKAMYSESLLM